MRTCPKCQKMLPDDAFRPGKRQCHACYLARKKERRKERYYGDAKFREEERRKARERYWKTEKAKGNK